MSLSVLTVVPLCYRLRSSTYGVNGLGNSYIFGISIIDVYTCIELSVKAILTNYMTGVRKKCNEM